MYNTKYRIRINIKYEEWQSTDNDQVRKMTKNGKPQKAENDKVRKMTKYAKPETAENDKERKITKCRKWQSWKNCEIAIWLKKNLVSNPMLRIWQLLRQGIYSRRDLQCWKRSKWTIWVTWEILIASGCAGVVKGRQGENGRRAMMNRCKAAAR